MAPKPQTPHIHPEDWRLSDDDESYTLENKVTLESINQRMTINFPIVSNYASHWGPVEAFRELVQNWRDGIIKSFEIAEDSFRVTCTEDNNGIVFKATGAKNSCPEQAKVPECLGYIRWFKQNGFGTVEVTNRQATLQPWHLDMGGTSKQNVKNQAGAHGEGLKVALLVLLRRPQNHAARCRSGGFSWTFNFTNQRRLVASLTRMTPTAIEKAHDQATSDVKNNLVPIETSPREDVQFFIGGNGTGRDENGFPTRRTEVTKEQFKNWTKSALFLQSVNDNNIVRTERGDLILDSRFSGSIYLKGLLLKESKNGRSASITGKKLQYGYNFADGVANREREFLTHADDELAAILRIWNRAFRLQDNMVAKFHELLNSEKPEYADVSQAEYSIFPDMRDYIKKFLLKEFKDKWLYSAKERSQNTRFDQIVQGLGREALEIKESYWTILRECGFRTAEEEEKKQFLAAKPTAIPDTGFAQSVYRLIRAGLDSCPQTADISVVFVNAGSVGLDSFYSPAQGLFKIHEKWLTIKGARDELGISNRILESSLLFNTAKRLFADAVTQVPTHVFHEGNRSRYWYRKQAISQGDQRILECTQIKQDLRYRVRRNEDSDTLVVKWNPGTGWLPETSIDIHFHLESTCSRLKDCLTARKIHSGMACFNQSNHAQGAIDTCIVMTASFRSGSCELQVKKGEQYFMILSNRSDPSSFLIHSNKPSAIEEVNSLLSTTTITSKTPQKSLASNGTKTFILKDPIGSLDIMAPRDWFTSTNTIGTEAVIGIAQGDTFQVMSPSTPTRNWQRGDGYSNGSPRRVRRRLF
ncbi:uncharacterized protein F4817DRAFT_366019 [Daldinia loculata]|uniref:uncharacterized protein n=1 Tax=Daldinia loculata TaxID=103429 RepID=UPI0020C34620|nr:uncharacterized protein F4817DRAFT_366019 [Daldinia loculata]KAI1646340.1 hypothetical protein F4817DRAFT_366019 [Daldinia loculata]